MDYLNRSSLLNAKFRRGDLVPKKSFKSGDDDALEKGNGPGSFQERLNITLQAQDNVRPTSDFVRSRNSRAELVKLFKPRFGSHPSTLQSRPFEASVKNELNNAVLERRRPGKKMSTIKPKSYITEKQIKTIPSQITTLRPKVGTTRPEERVSSFRGTAVRSNGLESGKRRHDSKTINNIPQLKNLKMENSKLLEQPLSGLSLLTKVEPFKGKTSYKPNFFKKSISPSKYNESDLAHATREKSIFTGSAFTSTISPESKRKIFRNTRRQFKNQNDQAVTLSYNSTDTESLELETDSPIKEVVELLLPTTVPTISTESLETEMHGKDLTSKNRLPITNLNSSENSKKFKLNRRRFSNLKITSQNDSSNSRQQSTERNLISQDVTITLPTHETEDKIALEKETSGVKSAKMETDSKFSVSRPNPDSPEPKPTTLFEELSPLSPRRSIKSRKGANSSASEGRKNNFPSVVRNVASKFNAKIIADEKEELVFAETTQNPFISNRYRKTGYRSGKRPFKRPVIRKGTQTISEDNSSDLSGIANENISTLTQKYDQSLSPPTTQGIQEQSHDVKHINKPIELQKDSNRFTSTKRANIARIRINKLNHVYHHISSSESKSSKKQHLSIPNEENSQLAYSVKDHVDLSHEVISITNVGNKLSPKKEYEVNVNLKSTENPINAQLSNSELTTESPESTVKSKQRLTLKKSLLSRRKFPSKLSKNKNIIDQRVTENLQNPNRKDVLNTNDELIASSTNIVKQIVPFRTTSDKLQTQLSMLEDGYNKNAALKESGSSFNLNRNRFNRRKFNQVNHSVINESSINSQQPKRRYEETISAILPVGSSENLAAVNQRTETSVKNETKHLDLHKMIQDLLKDQLTETEGVDNENASIFSGSTEQPVRSKLNRRKLNRKNFKNQKESSGNTGLPNRRNSDVPKKAETLEMDDMKSLVTDFIATNEQYITEQQTQNLQNTSPHNVEDDNLSISANSVRASKNRRTKLNRKRNNKFSSSPNVSSFNTRAPKRGAPADGKHSSIPKTHNREGLADSKEEKISSLVEEFEQLEPSRPVKNTNNPQVQAIEDFRKQETEFESVSFKPKKNKFVRKKFDDKKFFSLDEYSVNFQSSEKQNPSDLSTGIASKIHNNEEYDNSNAEDIPSFNDELESARGSYEQNDTPLESKVFSNRKRNRNVTHKRKFKKSSSTSRNNFPSNTQSSKQRDRIKTSVETATLLKQLDKTHYFINTNDNTASSFGEEQEQFVDHKLNPVPVDVQLHNRESADEQNAASSSSSEPSTNKRKRINRKRLHKLNRATENKSFTDTEINRKHNLFTKDITVPLPTKDTKDTANENVEPLFSLRNESNKLVPIKTVEFLANEQLHDMESINNINTTFAESKDVFNVEKKYNQKELHTQNFVSENEMHLSTTLGDYDSSNKYTFPFPKHKNIRPTRPSSTKNNIRQGTTSTKSNHHPFNRLEVIQTGSERWIPLKISQSSNSDMQVSNISSKKKSISPVIPKQFHSSRTKSSILNNRKLNPVSRTTTEASLTKDEGNASSEETKLYPVEKLPETITSFRGPQYPVNVELSHMDKVNDQYNEDEKTEMKPKQSNSPHSSPYGQSNSSPIENIEILSHHTPEETLDPSFMYYNSRYTNKTGQKTIQKNKFSKYYEDYPLMKEIPTKTFDETENYSFPEYDEEYPSFGDENKFSKVTQKYRNVINVLEDPNLDASGRHLSEKQKEQQFTDNTSSSGNKLQRMKIARPAGSYKERHSSFDSKLFSSPVEIISKSPYLTFYHSSKSKPKAQNFPYHFTSLEYMQKVPKIPSSNTEDWSQVNSRIKIPSSISELNLKAADTSSGSRSNLKGMSPTMENTGSQTTPIETINQGYMHYPSSKNPTLLVPSDEAKYYFYSSAMKPDSTKQISYSRPDFASNLPYSSKIDGAYDYSPFSKPIISSPLSKVYDSKKENGQYYLYSMNLGQKPTSKERNRTTMYPITDDQYKTSREKADLQAHSTKNIPQEFYNSFAKTALPSSSLPHISKKKQTEILFNTGSEDLSNVLQINNLYDSTGATEDLEEKSKGKVENLNKFNRSNAQLLNFKVEDSAVEHISNIVPSKNELISSKDTFIVNSLSPFLVDDFSNYSTISEFSTETPHPALRTIASVPLYLNDSALEVYPISTENSLAKILLPNSQDFESSEARIALITATEVPMNFMLTNVIFTQQNQANIQKTQDVVDVQELHTIENLFTKSNVSDSLSTFHRGSTALKPASDDLNQIILDSYDASAKSTAVVPRNEKELHLNVNEFYLENNNTKDEETGMYFAMTRNDQFKDASTDTQGYNIENGEEFKKEKKVTPTHPMLELVVQNSDAHDFISKISDKPVTVRLFNPKTQTYHSILITSDDNISTVETKIGKENSTSTNALPYHTYYKSEFEKKNANKQSIALFPEESVATEPTETGLSSKNDNYLNIFPLTASLEPDASNNNSSDKHIVTKTSSNFDRNLISVKDLKELFIKNRLENQNFKKEDNDYKTFKTFEKSENMLTYSNKFSENDNYLDVFSPTKSFGLDLPNNVSSPAHQFVERPLLPEEKLIKVEDLRELLINVMEENKNLQDEINKQKKFVSPLESVDKLLQPNIYKSLKTNNYLDIFSSTESIESGMPKVMLNTTVTEKPIPKRKLVNVDDLKQVLINSINSMKEDPYSKVENKSLTKFMSPLELEDKFLNSNKLLKNSNYLDVFSSAESFEFGIPNLIPSTTKTVTKNPDPERKLVNIYDLKQLLINNMKEDQDSKDEHKNQTKFMSPQETEEEFLHSNNPLKNNNYLDIFSPTESFELGTANVISKKFTEKPPPEKKLINIDDLKQLLVNRMKEDQDSKDENKNRTKSMTSLESEAKLIKSNYPYTNQAYFNMFPPTNSFEIDTSEIVSIGKNQMPKNNSKPGKKSQNTEFLNKRPGKNADKIQNASSQNNNTFHIFYQNLEDKIMDLDKSTESFESDLFDVASSSVHEITALPSKSENDLMNINDLKDFLIKSMEESSTYEDSKEKEIDLLNLQEDDEIIDELSLLIDFLAPTAMSNYSGSDIQFSVSESVVMNPHFESKTEDENLLGEVIDSTQNTFSKPSSYFEKQTQLNVPMSQYGEEPLEKVLSIMETYQILKPNMSKESFNNEESSDVPLKSESPAHFKSTPTDMPQHLVPLYFDIQDLEVSEGNRRGTKFPKYNSKFKKNALPSVEYDFEAFPKTHFSGTSFDTMLFENIPNNKDVSVINMKNETNFKYHHNTDEIQWNDSNNFNQYALPSSLANSQKGKKFHESFIGNGVTEANPGVSQILNYENFPPVLSTNSFSDALDRKAFENYYQIPDFRSKSKKVLSQNVKNRNHSQYTLSDLSPNFLQETSKNHHQELDFSNVKGIQRINVQNSSNSHVLQNLEISIASGEKEGSYIHPEKLTLKDIPQHIQQTIFDKENGSNIYTANSGIENDISEDNKSISFEEIKYSNPRPNIKNERDLSSSSLDISFKNITQDVPGKILFSDLIQGLVENGLHTVDFIGGKNYENLYIQVSNPETHPGIHFDESTYTTLQEVMVNNSYDSESAIKPITAIPVDEMKKRKKISEIPKLTPGLEEFMTMDYLDIDSLKSSIEQNRKGITDAENRFHSMKDDFLALNDYDDYLYPRFKTTMVK
ncbi:hypothetical protein TNCV_2940791 [Trichonephila clavipes]|nr:hypothetical protein TNCV_2940791 [Trichonephila clavipes]